MSGVSNGGREPVANELCHYMRATSRLAKRVAVLEDALAQIEALAGEGIEDVDLYRGPYVVRGDIGGMWKVCERESGRVLAVCFSRRIAYLVRRHLGEVLA